MTLVYGLILLVFVVLDALTGYEPHVSPLGQMFMAASVLICLGLDLRILGAR